MVEVGGPIKYTKQELTNSRLWLHGPSTLARFDFARVFLECPIFDT